MAYSLQILQSGWNVSAVHSLTDNLFLVVKESSIELFEVTREEAEISIMSYGEYPLYTKVRSSVSYGSYFIYCTQNDICIIQHDSTTHTWKRILRKGLMKFQNDLQMVGALMRRHDNLLGISGYHDKILFTRFDTNEHSLSLPVVIDLAACIIDWSFKQEIAIVLTQTPHTETQQLKILRVNQDTCLLEYEMPFTDLLSNSPAAFPVSILADLSSSCIFLAFENKQIKRLTFTEPFITNIEVDTIELPADYSSWIMLETGLYVSLDNGTLVKYSNGNLSTVESIAKDSMMCSDNDILFCIGSTSGIYAIDLCSKYKSSYPTPMPILDATFVEKEGKTIYRNWSFCIICSM